MKYTHIMVDLETMSLQDDAAIMSIGAVPFCPVEGLAPEAEWFHEKCSLRDNEDAGRHVDGKTVEWWLTQDPEAQLELIRGPRKTFGRMIQLFQNWLMMNNSVSPKFVWAMPPTFDIVILKNAFAQVGRPWPFKYNKVRDVRTLLDVAGLDRLEFEGVPHRADHDAAYQARMVIEAYKILRVETAE